MSDEMEQRLAAAAQAVRERELAERRAAELSAREREISGELDRLREQYAVEQHDVDRLQGLTLARVLSSMAGSREDKLARERAEADAAGYRVAQAQERLTAVRRERDEALQRADRLAGAPAAYAAALAEKERWLEGSGDPRASRLLALAAERGRLEAELREASEAIQAADAARAALADVARSLDSAAGWSTYDTWFGGGIIASSIKHDHMDQAEQAAAEADRRLAVLRTELADVTGAGAIAPLPVGEGTRFADIWFDNFFTDISVDSRIKQAEQNVDRAAGQVGEVKDRLADVLTRARAGLTAIESERRSLLGG